MSIFPKALGGNEEGRGDGRNGGKRDGSEHEAVGWVLGGKGALKTKELHHVCVCVSYYYYTTKKQAVFVSW